MRIDHHPGLPVDVAENDVGGFASDACSVTRSSMRSGTLPPKRSTIARAADCNDFAF